MQFRQQIVIVHIDLCKTFDVISHHKLFARLHSYGIRRSAFYGCTTFLLDAHTKLKLVPLLALSDIIVGLISGVGSLMFLIYISMS